MSLAYQIMGFFCFGLWFGGDGHLLALCFVLEVFGVFFGGVLFVFCFCCFEKSFGIFW